MPGGIERWSSPNVVPPGSGERAPRAIRELLDLLRRPARRGEPAADPERLPPHGPFALYGRPHPGER